MDKVELTIGNLVLSVICIYFFSIDIAIFLIVGITIIIGILLKEKNIFFYIIPILFILRILFFTSSLELKINEKVKIEAKILEGRGKIKKINNKFSLSNDYVRISNYQDGYYTMEGRIKRIKKNKKYNEYEIETIIIKRKIKNKSENLLEKRIDKISQNSTNEQKNLYKAIVNGDNDFLYKRVKILFQKTGTAHLLALSGLHIGILLYLFNKLYLFCQFRKVWRNILILISISIYFVSVRESPSISRAYIMAIIYIAGNIFYENTELRKTLLITFLINVFITPNIFREVSFILSYSAIAGIILIKPILLKINKICSKKVNKVILKIINYISFTVILQLVLSPLLKYLFSEYSLVSIWYSLIITPIGTVYIVLCFLSLVFPLMPLTNICYNILIKIMEFVV